MRNKPIFSAEISGSLCVSGQHDLQEQRLTTLTSAGVGKPEL